MKFVCMNLCCESVYRKQKSLGKSSEMKSYYEHSRTWSHRTLRVFCPSTNAMRTVCRVKRVICYSFNLTNVSIPSRGYVFAIIYLVCACNVSGVFFVPVIANVAVGCGRAENTQFQQSERSKKKNMRSTSPTSKLNTYKSPKLVFARKHKNLYHD